MAELIPPLELLNPEDQHIFEKPQKHIYTDADIERFQYTHAYLGIGQFLTHLNQAVIPRIAPADQVQPAATSSIEVRQPATTSGASTSEMKPPVPNLTRRLKQQEASPVETFTIHSKREDPPSVQQLRALLDKLKSFIDEAPPSQEQRRFGNISFRTWHQLLEQRVDDLLNEYLPPHVVNFRRPPGKLRALDEIRVYFLGAFGSPTRLDYGTGHELSFLAFLACLWKLGAFKDGAGGRKYDTERSIVFGVFEPYFNLMRKLILTYTLEPAGSHGVWGLDDHFHLPYIFGSAQLTRPIAADDEPTPQEGSVRGAPKLSDVVKLELVDLHRAENMYFAAVGFIYDVKKGPFWEHSPILYNVSGIKDGWGKINKGMVKMFQAEVLAKFPVVQHFPFGSLLPWTFHEDVPEHIFRPMPTPTIGNPMGAPDESLNPWVRATGPPVPSAQYARPLVNPVPPEALARLGQANKFARGVREFNAARRRGEDAKWGDLPGQWL